MHLYLCQKIGQLSYHMTKILTSAFYNAMQLGETFNSAKFEIMTENCEGINEPLDEQKIANRLLAIK